jgi:hypothetical protein
MRRIISATVALALSGAIWACSSSSNNGSSTDGGGATGGTGGTAATGGTSSTGGKAATGGTSATGGTTAATGGTTGTGGAATGGTGGTTTDGGDAGPPGPPVLGAQIDRLGRPGVNTALTDPFDIETTSENDVKDAYNAASDPTKWAASFQSEIEQNLAIINGLDANCENQLAESPTKTDGGTSRYSALGGVLVDDELYVNTAATTCGQYLAVEANATGIVPNADCGGRTLSYDVIDTTYSALAIGALSGVGDGVSEDDHADKQTATFPFLAPPQ